MNNRIMKIVLLLILLCGLVGCQERKGDSYHYQLEEADEWMTLRQETTIQALEDEVIYYEEKVTIELKEEKEYEEFKTSIADLQAENVSKNKPGMTYTAKVNDANKSIENIRKIDLSKAAIEDYRDILTIEADGKVSLTKLEEILMSQGLNKVEVKK